MKRLLSILAIALVISACGYRNSVYSWNGKEYARIAEKDTVVIYEKTPRGTWRRVYFSDGGIVDDDRYFEPGTDERLLEEGKLVGTLTRDQIVDSEKKPPRLPLGEGVRKPNPVTEVIVQEGGSD